LTQPDKSKWTPMAWQAYVASLSTREERKEALDNEVPAEWRARVENHVRTVYSIRAFQNRVAFEKGRG